MSIFIRTITSCLVIEVLARAFCLRVGFGPFGVFTETDITNTTTSSMEKSSLSFVTSTSTVLPKAFSSKEYSGLLQIRDYVVIFLSLLGFLSSSSFFILQIVKYLNVRYKCSRCKLARRTPSESAAIDFNNRVVELDPLRSTVVDIHHELTTRF